MVAAVAWSEGTRAQDPPALAGYACCSSAVARNADEGGRSATRNEGDAPPGMAAPDEAQKRTPSRNRHWGSSPPATVGSMVAEQGQIPPR